MVNLLQVRVEVLKNIEHSIFELWAIALIYIELSSVLLRSSLMPVCYILMKNFKCDSCLHSVTLRGLMAPF